MRWIVVMLALFLAVPLSVPAQADPSVLARLAEPHTHAIMRHALAPGSGDPENFDLFDCATQRNLSDDGRRQAARAGDMLRAAGVQIDAVWSSFYCRNLETAELMAMGAAQTLSNLNFFGRDKSSNRRRTQAVIAAMAEMPDDQTLLVVGHSANIEAITGTRPISGEVQVVRITPDGAVTLLGRVEVPVF
ncbi:MAG: histidine phosphatase family protein [Pseudomonadota bacterium]